MRTHVALLRGINVGGHNKLAMADLKVAVASLGHTAVETYLQSGNVVFTSYDPNPASIAGQLQKSLTAQTSQGINVVVVDRDEWAELVNHNPYPHETDPRRLHAMVHPSELTTEDFAALDLAQRRARDKGSADELTAIGRTIYLSTPNGMGRSELASNLTRYPQAPLGTARNWATVNKITALLNS